MREHLDTYAEKDDGSEKEFWISFYNLAVRLAGWLSICLWALCIVSLDCSEEKVYGTSVDKRVLPQHAIGIDSSTMGAPSPCQMRWPSRPTHKGWGAVRGPLKHLQHSSDATAALIVY